MKLFERVIVGFIGTFVKNATAAANAEGFRKFVHISPRHDGTGNAEFFKLTLESPDALMKIGSQRKGITATVFVDSDLGAMLIRVFEIEGAIDIETGVIAAPRTISGSVHSKQLPNGDVYKIIGGFTAKNGTKVSEDSSKVSSVRIFVWEDADVADELDAAVRTITEDQRGRYKIIPRIAGEEIDPTLSPQ